MSTQPTTLAREEALMSAFDAHGYARRRVESGELTAEACKAEVHTLNVLFDACLSAGMSFDEPSVTDWAAQRVARFLTTCGEDA